MRNASRHHFVSVRPETASRVGAFEAEKQLRRCIRSWCDRDLTRQEWERMYPKDVRDRALHRMTPEQLRSRE